jgi:hypothetical protein
LFAQVLFEVASGEMRRGKRGERGRWGEGEMGRQGEINS